LGLQFVSDDYNAKDYKGRHEAHCVGEYESDLFLRWYRGIEKQVDANGQDKKVVADVVANAPQAQVRESEGRSVRDAAAKQKTINGLVCIDNGEDGQQPSPIVPQRNVKMPGGGRSDPEVDFAKKPVLPQVRHRINHEIGPRGKHCGPDSRPDGK